jgi:hypothetical protein
MEPTSRQSHTTSSGLELSESIEKARDLPPLSSFPLSQAEPYSKDYEMIANDGAFWFKIFATGAIGVSNFSLLV